MPYVPVPKDLTKVKTKVALGLTKRQLVCFGSAAVVGIPTYLLTRGGLGNEVAVILMIGLMLPFFFFAMYEKDGQPAEKIVRNLVRARLWPGTRPYKTQNLYANLNKEDNALASKKPAANGTAKAAGRQRAAGQKQPGRPAGHAR